MNPVHIDNYGVYGDSMLHITTKRVFCYVLYCLAILSLPCLGQATQDSPDSKTDPVIRKRFTDIFPDADSSKIQMRQAFQDKRDYRKSVVTSVKAGVPADDATLLQAYVSSSMGMEYGTSISLDAILCSELTAVRKIEGDVSKIMTQRKFNVIQGWDDDGFAAFRSRQCNNIFKAQSLCEDATLLLKLDRRLSDQYGMIRLIYEVKAGPRRNDTSSFAEPDKAQSAELEEYMGILQTDVKSSAVNAIGATCSKITSENKKSDEDAISDVSNHLKTKTQRDQLKAAVERKK